MSEVIALEVAEKEFDNFMKDWDIEDGLDNKSAEEIRAFKSQKNRIVKCISEGHAKLDEDSNITYTLKYPNDKGSLRELLFKIPKANVFTSMDNHGEEKHMSKLNTAIANITGLPPKVISNLDARDIKFCQAVTGLFLGG